jgi:hypothetical protein
MNAQLDVADRLANRLRSFADGLEGLERLNLNIIMSIAAGGLAPHGQLPSVGARAAAWKAVVSTLEHLHSAGLTEAGRIPFIEEEYFADIVREATDQEAIAHRTGPQELAPGGPVAEQLAVDPRLLKIASRAIGGELLATGISSYLYYKREGDHLYPHVDTEIFAVNVILMVEHVAPARGDGSALQIFAADGPPSRVVFAPGEAVVLQAGGTVHGREAVAGGERVTILTIGFQRIGSVGGE